MGNKRKWYPILLIGLVLLLVSSFTGCAAGKSEVTEPSSTPLQTPIKSDLKVHFIDVGQGDSILVDLNDIEVLIDGGDRSPGVVEYLKKYVNGPLEVMIATHPHADHIGGLIDVLAAFEVKEVWHNGENSTSKTYSDFISAVNAENTKVGAATRGDVIEADGLSFKVLNPVDLSGTTNNNSIVLYLAYGEIDFLFEGDAEKEAEAAMLMEGIVPDVEILKVGHHGSRTASSMQFLQVAKPELAIYMAGKGNSYGHPHVETIAALTQVGAEIYGTDICGTVVVTSDGHEYTLPAIAKFTTTGLSITPAEVSIGESVTISVVVTNTGGITGTYAVTPKINNVAVESKSVTLAGGASQRITFTIVKDVAETYTVGIDGLSGTFKVKAAPAKFTVSNLSISPDDVEPGRTVTISATVTNSGGSSGSYTAILKINGSQVETKSVTLNAGESQVVSFTVVKASTGNYAVELGGLAGTFIVTEPSDSGCTCYSYTLKRDIPCEQATAICRDGTCSISTSRRGTCSHHGGVARWLK
jgi:beta-lactamase superfamily II metal-dependent hydrolase